MEAERHPGRLDVPGAVTGTGGLLALVYGITRGGEHGWGNGVTLATFSTSAANDELPDAAQSLYRGPATEDAVLIERAALR